MRILHVNKFFDMHGGAEVYVHRLLAAQARAGHEVHAFSTRQARNQPSEDASRFVRREDLDRREGPVADTRKAIKFVWNVEAERAMRSALHDLKPEIVHVHNLYHHLSSSVLAPIRESGIPCVQTLHDYKLACPNYRMFTEGSACERCKGGHYFEAVRHSCLASGFLPNVLAALEMGMTKARQSYERTVRLFFCPSHFLQEKMEDWGEPPGKLRYVPNPVDMPETAARRGGGYLLYVGRLAVEKGLESFVHAAALIPELPVKIAGRGPEEERLRSWVWAHHAQHIEFLGFQSPEALARLREHAEALVLPSVWYENASLAILEAMAQGLPCLVTRIGGNPELIKDGQNGFLVQPGSEEDWLRVLRRFQALSQESRDEMGRVSRKKVDEHFLWSTHLQRLDGLYREAGAL